MTIRKGRIFGRMIVLLLLISVSMISVEAKKIKNTHKPPKAVKTEAFGSKGEGIELKGEDLKGCSFAGYDKEANSNKESFLIVNSTDHEILGFCVRIDYLDMKGRMLHSRIVEEKCDVPPHEARRIDIKSWDTQHTYYYYLGNEPKRVATPFQVSFTPVSYIIANG